MANGTRRLTAFLVALVLIVSLLPAAGVAADVDGSDGAAVVTEEEPADKTEGSPETTGRLRRPDHVRLHPLCQHPVHLFFRGGARHHPLRVPEPQEQVLYGG